MMKDSVIQKRIRVLVVDDSATMRAILVKILESDPLIEIIGTAHDPYVAREKLVRLRPDVMTLDLEMPRMGGLEFLIKVMSHLPTRTLIISNHSPTGSANALRALEAGAIDVMAKPVLSNEEQVYKLKTDLIERIKMVASASLPGERRGERLAIRSQSVDIGVKNKLIEIIAIASSTGGTEALKKILTVLPVTIPPIVIVQHMPVGFTQAFAQRLSSMCPFPVQEVRDGEVIQAGNVYLAPGDFHFEVKRHGRTFSASLHQEPPLHGVRPAADYLLKSVARYFGENALGIVLTGMGRDGADGLLAMRAAGATTFGQDEASSVVYGMPKAAKEAGAVQVVLGLDRIAGSILKKIA